MLIIKEIIIAKCQNCICNNCNYGKRKCICVKSGARTVRTYLKLMLKPYFNGYFFTLKKGYTPETSMLIDNFDTLR